jgi:hypothetical protein
MHYFVCVVFKLQLGSVAVADCNWMWVVACFCMKFRVLGVGCGLEDDTAQKIALSSFIFLQLIEDGDVDSIPSSSPSSTTPC